MKALVFILAMILTCNAYENKIIISGITKHFIPMDIEDQTILKMTSYNELNIGYGYEINNYSEKNNQFFNLGANIIKDSFNNDQYSICIGYNYLFKLSNIIGIQVGINAGIANRALGNYNKTRGLIWEYNVIPLLFPRVTIKTKYFDINTIFIPTITDIIKSGCIYYTLGINF